MRRDLGKRVKYFFGAKIIPVYFNFPPPQKSWGLKTDVPVQKNMLEPSHLLSLYQQQESNRPLLTCWTNKN